MMRHNCIVMVVWAAALLELAAAQSVCVPDPVEVERLEGAVLFEASGKSAPLQEVTVSILPFAGRSAPLGASFVTKRDGRFSIEHAAPGRYWLSFQHNALIGFCLELRVRRRGRRPKGFLIATIRNDPNKPCGGGTVRLASTIEGNGIAGAGDGR